MPSITRREFLVLATSFGATLAWPGISAFGSASSWKERRDLYPHGVASGDPHPDSVILWTRRPPTTESTAARLTLELSESADFRHVVSSAVAGISEANDWTCRVLAAGLKPDRVYWYRFADEHGFGSRVGRAITAPAEDNSRDVRFAFVSCQNVQQGACNAYRRMIWEDEQRPAAEQLGFVLHLGDFIYEIVWYPEDRPQGMYARRIRDIVRYKSGEKHADFHVPTTVEDYRAVYKAYLLDPDLQDARARWPFVCMWDNHEFSWRGWQSQQDFGEGLLPAQTRKVAAAQAWFEYQPARVVKPGTPNLNRFVAPKVADKPISDFDRFGMGQEAGNLAAIKSLTLYRALRWGRHVDLILTDNRSYRSQPVGDRDEVDPFGPPNVFPGAGLSPDVAEILDAGKTYNNGKPPATISFNGSELPNPRRNAEPQSMLGGPQKEWFLNQLRKSNATWKLWGNSVAMLSWRIDFQNLPSELGVHWPVADYGQFADQDWAGYCTERNQILDFLKSEKITNFATLAGDRHSFQAGVLSTALPPKAFHPVGAEFVTGSISAPCFFEAMEYKLPKDHPLYGLYLYKPAADAPVQPAMNFAVMYGVKAALALQKSHDVTAALAEKNPEVSPHLSFVDAGGHGYAVVHVKADAMEVEFVCVPRPIERSERPDGGPLAYRIAHLVKSWQPGSVPKLERTRVEGTLPLIV
jgi:alkaline phosphatase D